MVYDHACCLLVFYLQRTTELQKSYSFTLPRSTEACRTSIFVTLRRFCIFLRQNCIFHIASWILGNGPRFGFAPCILAELSRCQVPVPRDRFNFSPAISPAELQADGWRNGTTPRRTLALLKGLFKVLVGLTLREIEMAKPCSFMDSLYQAAQQGVLKSER